MTQGYSLRLRDLNLRAPSSLLGVRLGQLCIEHDVPVTVVAQQIGVTRQTVYNWFAGTFSPQPVLVPRIKAYITQFD